MSYSLYNTVPVEAFSNKTEGLAASSTNVYWSQPWKAAPRDWGLQIVTTGTLTGTWKLYASERKHPDLTSNTDWVDMSTHADFVETNPAGAATNWRTSSILLKSEWLRLEYTNASGTGNIFAFVTHQ